MSELPPSILTYELPLSKALQALSCSQVEVCLIVNL